MAELVRDVPDAEAGVVEPGRHGLAEGVAGHPLVADPVECGPEVAFGVGRVAQLPRGGGEDDARGSGAGTVGSPGTDGRDHGAGEGEQAMGGRGLGTWLDLQT